MLPWIFECLSCFKKKTKREELKYLRGSIIPIKKAKIT